MSCDNCNVMRAQTASVAEGCGWGVGVDIMVLSSRNATQDGIAVLVLAAEPPTPTTSYLCQVYCWTACVLGDVPVDVKHSNERVLLDRGVEGFVDVVHDPSEELGVDVLGEGVAGIDGLQLGDGLDVGLRGRLQLLVTQPVGHVLVRDPHEVTEDGQVLVVRLEQECRLKIFTQGFCHPELCRED